MGSTTYTGVISSLRSVSHIEYFIVKYADES